VTIPAVSPLNFGLVDALDRIGFKGPLLPSADRGIQPVMVIADISQSVSSEIVEARRIASVSLAPQPGNFSSYVIFSRSPGGLVVEHLAVEVDQGTVFPPFVRVQVVANPPVGGPGSGLFTDLGGRAGSSIPIYQVSAVAPIVPGANGCGGILCFTMIAGTLWKGEAPARVYVPPGSALIVCTDAVNAAFGAQVVWRELADIQGVP
jgi:hypothetical protein